MKPSKKEALTQFHRNNILAVAEELFAEKGIEKTTMDHIAKTADYSKATLYVYFKNKEDIINTLTFNSMKVLYEKLHDVLTHTTDFFESYKKLCYELVAYNEDYPLYAHMVLGSINVDIDNPNTPAIFKEIFELGEAINKEIGIFFERGIKEGFVQPELPLVPTIFLFWASIAGNIKLATQKEAYITTFISMTKQDYLDFSFKTLLQSILKEGVVNAY